MLGVGTLLLGLLLLGVELGCAFAVSARVVGRWGPDRERSVSVLAHGVVITAFLLAVHVVPGALGVVSRFTVLAASLLGLGAVLALTRGPATRAAVGPGTALGGEGLVRWLLALAAVGLVVGYTGGFLRSVFGTVPVGVDSLTFHLPDVASWIRTGSLWQIDQFVPGQANGNYPNNGDVLFLLLALPFRSALLARAAMLPYLALTGLGVYAMARELGASRPSATTYGAAVCAIPSVAWPALLDTETDTLMLFGLAAAVALMLRHSRTRSRFHLILAGIALGIAFGTKWYAVPGAVVVLVVWGLGQWLNRERWRAIGRGVAWLLGLTLLMGGFWLLRNLVESGDPLFPARVAPFGVTLFPAPPDLVQQEGGFTIGDYLLKASVLRTYIVPALSDALQAVGVLISACGLAAGVLAAWDLRRRAAARRQSAGVLLVVLTGVLLAVVYVFTPDTALGPRNFPVQAEANVRYLMPALVLAAPAAAWLTTRLPRLGFLLQLAAVALIVKALARIYPSHEAVALGLAVITFVVGMTLWRAALGRRAPRLAWLAPVYGLVMLVLVASTFLARHRFTYRTYAASDATLAWLLTHAPADHSVGLANVWSNAGFSPVLPAFGPRLENRVGYVGPFVRHLLGQYASEPAFAEALRRGGYQFLIIGLGFPNPQPSVTDEAWARAAGYREIAQSPRLALFARTSGSPRTTGS